jgi:hypothetical protein
MRFIRTFLILTICLGVIAAVSPAQPPKGKKGSKGGGQSAEEMANDIVTRMMAFDKNKDGQLTRDEITDPRLLRLFDRADANKDGVVTREELTALARQMAAEAAAEGGGKGGKGGPGGFGPGGKKGGKDKGPDDFGPPGKGGKDGPGSFGPGGKKGGFGGFGPKGPPRPGQILPPFLQEMLNLSADQKKQLDALQSEVDAKLAKILTAEQKKQLQEMPGPGKFGPPGKLPPPPGGGFPPPPDDQGERFDASPPEPAGLPGRRDE